MEYSDEIIPIDITLLAGKYKLCLTLTERDFTVILGDDFYRVLNVMNQAIGEENLSEDVLHLVLTGEGCRVPGLKRRI